MDAAFWRERWSQGQIGFHQQDVTAQLARHWESLGLDVGAPVFVPMCGKTLDMHWLAARGHPVLGVEVSDLAVRDFFAEANLAPKTSPGEAGGAGGRFDVSTAGGIRLLCGDFFELTADDVAEIRAVYDRAAFVALPPEQRSAYAAHMLRILPASVALLVIAFEYDHPEFAGPPFSVTEDEIRNAYGDAFRIEVLECSGPHPAPDHLKARGLEAFSDTALRLTR